MKDESNKAFLHGFGGQIQGQLLEGATYTDTIKETGETLCFLEFWMQSELSPDHLGQMHLKDTAALDDAPTEAVVIDKPEDAQGVLRILEAGMIYLYAHLGIDHARLVQRDGTLGFVDTAVLGLTSREALKHVSTVFEIKRQLFNGAWDSDALLRSFTYFHMAMGLGDNHIGKDFTIMSGLVEMDDEEFEIPEHGRDHDEVPINADVCVRYCDAERFEITHRDHDNHEVHNFYTLNSVGVLLAFKDLQRLAMNRSASTPEECKEFWLLYKSLGRPSPYEGIDLDQVVAEMVEKELDPRITQALEAYNLSMDHQGPRTLN